MKNTSNQIGLAIWSLVLAAFAACSPIQTSKLTPSPSTTNAILVLPIKTSTSASSPSAIILPTSTTSTPTIVPDINLVSSPAPTFTPSLETNFRFIQMIDMQKGWAIMDFGTEERSHVLRTVDGGANWRDVSPGYERLFGSFFLDDQAAWLWNNDSVWRTLDSGLTWTSIAGFGWLPDVWFNDSQHGWKLNAEVWGLSYRQFDIISYSSTQDGGQTWQDANPPSDQGVTLLMAYPTSQMAWAISAGFAKTSEGIPNLAVPFSIQTTFDGGSTWTTRQMPLPPESNRVERPYEGAYLGGAGNCEFISPVYSSTAIWKLALTCESRSWMYTTANHGDTWIISSMPAGIDVHIQFVDPSTGWLFLGGRLQDFQGSLYQTTDGGQNWTLIKRTGWGDVQLSFVDAQTGWAIACNQGYCYDHNVEKALLMTSNGGVTWRALNPQLEP